MDARPALLPDVGATILTVNNRLARDLQLRYDSEQVRRGRRAWPSIDVLPWGAWLQRCYQRLLDDGIAQQDLLTPAQERLLWQQAILEDPELPPLLRTSAAARRAAEAYRLVRDWQLDAHPLARLGGDDTQAFLRWRVRFEAIAAGRGLLSPADLPALIAQAVADGALTPPARLVLAGFDTLAPALDRLLDRLRAAGCTIAAQDERTAPGDRFRFEAEDGEDELRRVARQVIARRARHPQQRLGVVCIDLQQRRAAVRRIFTEAMSPAACLSGGEALPPFGLSLGEPLADQPLVGHALLLLDLLTGAQPLASVGQILRSPFVGGHADEWNQRAGIDVALRRNGRPLVDLGHLLWQTRRLDPGSAAACSDLQARLERVAALHRGLPRRADPAHWALHLGDLLTAFGWPGDATLDSNEFQQRERLARLLSEFAALGKVRAAMDLGEAVRELRQLAADAIFQPESAPGNVLILGPLESAGMAFDATWIIGLDDQVWPAPPQPHPLLPNALQRELGMPHASAERELEFAERLIERILASCGRVVASHARRDGDREQRPSPLVADWPPLDEPIADDEPDALRAVCAGQDPRPLVAPDGTVGPPTRITGGASLLAAQAACPFAAVAHFRLRARPLDEATFAPDPALSGTLVHELLQRVWHRLGDSAALAAHDEQTLAGLVEPLATAVLNDIGRKRPDLYTARFCALEQQRLTRLLLAWLDCERTRGQSFAVVALEQDRTVRIGGLALATRADRVDRLADGGLAVIDYKTGRKPSIDGWFDERLTEPQLPLYAMTADEPVSAAALARVRRDDGGCRFIGLSTGQDLAPGAEAVENRDALPAWDALQAQWHGAIEQLAREIADGRAEPTPSEQACRYCELGALCRVQEMVADDGDGPDVDS